MKSDCKMTFPLTYSAALTWSHSGQDWVNASHHHHHSVILIFIKILIMLFSQLGQNIYSKFLMIKPEMKFHFFFSIDHFHTCAHALYVILCLGHIDMLSLTKIAGGSCLMKFKKKYPKKLKILTLGQNFLKSYACKLEKLQLDPQ